MNSPTSDSSPDHVGLGRRLVEGSIALVLIGAVAYGASQLPNAGGIRPAPEAARALPVDAVPVALVDGYESDRRFAGEIRARRTSVLSFDRIAQVVELPVMEGQAVEAGELLARIDTRDLDARRGSVQAALEASRAVLAELVAGPRSEKIDAARARVRELEARLDLARTIAERRALLRESEAVSLEELQAADREVSALEASAAAAVAELAELEAGTRREQVEAQRAEVARIEAQLTEIEVDLAQSRMVAPFDGIVRAVALDVGTVPVPGAATVELVEADAPEAWIGLPPERVAELTQLGDGAAPLRVEIGEREFEARFRTALPSVDESTRTRTVILELLDVQIGEIVPGQVVELSLPERFDERGAWLGADGLVRSRRGLWAAFVLEPLAGAELDAPVGSTHVLRRRELETLATDGLRVLVRGDLAPGELVLASGAQRVSAGQHVRLIDASANLEGDGQ